MQRRAARGPAEEEAAAPGVAERPDLIPGALQAEHRIEDVEGQHVGPERRVGGAGGGERGHRACLGDPFLEHLAVQCLAVGEQRVGVHRLVALAER